MHTIDIVFRDDDCLVVNKSAGLAVQGGAGITTCLIDILGAETGESVFPVHRLDRDTSGLILFALNRDAAAFFSKMFATRAVEKSYLALTALPKNASPLPPRGAIRETLTVKGRSLPSVTHYEIQKQSARFALFRLRLGTGRTHQIRRHLASSGYPILGDDKYGDFPLNKRLRKETGLKRLLLHAEKLRFEKNEEVIEIKAPPPLYWRQFLDELDAKT